MWAGLQVYAAGVSMTSGLRIAFRKLLYNLFFPLSLPSRRNLSTRTSRCCLCSFKHAVRQTRMQTINIYSRRGQSQLPFPIRWTPVSLAISQVKVQSDWTLNKARSIRDKRQINFTCVSKIRGEWFLGANVAVKTWRCILMRLTEVIWSDRMAPVVQDWTPGLSDKVHRFDVGIAWYKETVNCFQSKIQTCRGKN